MFHVLASLLHHSSHIPRHLTIQSVALREDQQTYFDSPFDHEYLSDGQPTHNQAILALRRIH